MGVEAGVGFFGGETVEFAGIRENRSYYYPSYARDYYSCGYVDESPENTHYYFGIKPEYSLNSSITVSAGLRFVGSSSALESDRDYFLWKVAESDLTTNYVRVKSVKQNSFYLGIPIEMSVALLKRDLRVRPYFKAGVNLNFLIVENTTPYFENDAMNSYKDEILRDIGKNDLFAPVAFIGTGLKIGRMNRPFGTVEIRIPFVLKENAGFSSFVKSSAGFEMQAAIYIPMGKQKLGYMYRSR
jgi:hypothetical protein